MYAAPTNQLGVALETPVRGADAAMLISNWWAMEKLLEHFSVISVATTLWITAVVLSFYGGFLDYFNADIFQVIDYADIFKLDIEAFSIFAPSVGAFWFGYVAYRDWATDKVIRAGTYLIGSLLVLYVVYNYIHNGIMPRFYGITTLLMAVNFLGVFMSRVKEWHNVNKLIFSIWASMFAILLARNAGSEYAKYVNDSESFLEIRTGGKGKFGDELYNVKLIISLSARTIVLKGRDVIVLPNDDIIAMTFQGKPALSGNGK